MEKIFKSVMALTIALAMVACGGNANNGGRKSQELSGAGATFPLPFYNVVFEQFRQANGDQVAYGGIGSGGGVRNLRDKIVDFAGSDAFLSDKEMAEMAPVVHIPTCMGAVVVAYNLDGVKELKLSGEVIADIFAGNIKMWNNERIAALNPDVKLPSEVIIPVYRSDGSGTTFVFTDYLTKVSPMWREKFGAGKSVNFPSGQAAKGNPGVAGVIKQTKNSIGYVGSEYAFAQKIPYARIQNLRGEFVLPSSATISAAASGVIPADTRCSITNADAAGAYPISTFTWMIIYKEQNYSDRSKEQAAATLDLLKYILSDEAQHITSEVHYAPLPAKAKELSMTNLKTVTYDGVAILQ
ncbi:phosphate ABC transporter substrate-binding protein PstS [uncultured Rikenella sp.]|uniref:phosphate ABC transporter substrate-binding protein PstS n=1 Tax=uncultured Rikenella sp. TaxID=368003 RepID=UPI0025D5BF49|nr:phosphate ABC transporter substrate-binding protein PstS [uncultured Rikenella sp.]